MGSVYASFSERRIENLPQMEGKIVLVKFSIGVNPKN
jgi:hypothetical protein